MSKKQPGQVVLDAIKWEIEKWSMGITLDETWILDKKIARQVIEELKAYRAAFKKMAGAELIKALLTPQDTLLSYRDNLALAQAILNARECEARRKT